MHKEIPFAISHNELLIRGIQHPMFYSNSNNEVKREAFLPPPQRRDVSILRREYASTDSSCKLHCKAVRLPNNSYCGMATFLSNHIDEINSLSDIKTSVEVKGSPINEEGEYINSTPVYTDTPGLPLHADIIYDAPTIRGEPNAEHRIYANKLAKKVRYFHDPTPSKENWSGEKLKYDKAS